ncbi:6,7-dimethyl-8-ribityllumazine synthase [Nocardia callitridis]|uniref:6,7-dimethyl-8-ribityllumazine synthase n=1 Tax=Nocardia callitridis TaxID=648753 RepID=A0ABP9KK21_9NOCA
MSNNSVAFIRASWHTSIVGRALEGFTAEFAALGYDSAGIDVFEVAGAFEIPLHAKRLAASGKYAAIVASALVVDGGIYRHDFVASAVIDGLMRVQLDSDVPVFSVVLTPHHFHEHSEHVTFFTEHFHTKGAEAARALASTLSSLRSLPV